MMVCRGCPSDDHARDPYACANRDVADADCYRGVGQHAAANHNSNHICNCHVGRLPDAHVGSDRHAFDTARYAGRPGGG